MNREEFEEWWNTADLVGECPYNNKYANSAWQAWQHQAARIEKWKQVAEDAAVAKTKDEACQIVDDAMERGI